MGTRGFCPEVGKSIGFRRNSEKANVAGAGGEKGACREMGWGGWRVWATLGIVWVCHTAQTLFQGL